jgi:hypothetical protein
VSEQQAPQQLDLLAELAELEEGFNEWAGVFAPEDDDEHEA